MRSIAKAMAVATLAVAVQAGVNPGTGAAQVLAEPQPLRATAVPALHPDAEPQPLRTTATPTAPALHPDAEPQPLRTTATPMASALDADAEPLFSRQFACARVINAWRDCDTSSKVSVGAGQWLCVAVRGSRGHGIRFRAVNSSKQPVGDESPPLVVGSPKACIFHNTAGGSITVSIQAKANFGVNVDVFATLYVQSTA